MILFEELSYMFYLLKRQFNMIFPFWISGIIAGSFISVFLSEGIAKLVGKIKEKKFNISGVFLASFLGAASPLCMYGTVPVIAALGKKGTPQYLLAAFMISSILINPNLLIFSFALGVPIAMLRLAFSLIAGITAGSFVYSFYPKQNFFYFENFEGSKCLKKAHTVKGLLLDIHKAIVITAPYFLIGIFLAAIFESYVPKMWIVELFGTNRELGVLLAVSLGVPVYVCGGGTIPLLKGWLNTGMSVGAVIAFALSGASTKLTNLSAVKIILGLKNFIIYLLFNLIFALISGWLIDWFY